MKGEASLEYLMTYGFAILVILIIGVALYTSGVFNPGTAVGKSYNGLNEFTVMDWITIPTYMKEINISNSNDELFDYQIPINLTYSNHMKPDFSNIRFSWYNSSSMEEVNVPYWIEDKSNSNWAKIWIKVPEIPASLNETVYAHYGNPIWKSDSNPYKTLINSVLFGGSDHDFLYSVTSDGNYIYAVGFSRSEGNQPYNPIIAKYYPNLTLISQKVLNSSDDSHFYSVTSNGNYVYAAGYVGDDALIVKFYPNLSVVSQKTFGGSDDDLFYHVYSDGNYIYAVGYTKSSGAGGADALIVKYYPNLTLVSQETLGGSDTDLFYHVYSDGNYIYAVGYTESAGSGGADALIVKYYPNLSVVSQKTFGGSNNDYFVSVYPNGDYLYVVGETKSTGAGGSDALIAKYYPNLTLVSQETLGGSDDDYFASIYSDGNYIYAVGASNLRDSRYDDGLIAKYYPNLTLVSQKTFGGDGYDYFYSIYPFGDYLYVGGYTNSEGSGVNDGMVIKFLKSLSMKVVYPHSLSFSDNSLTSSTSSLSQSDSSLTASDSSLSENDGSLILKNDNLNITDVYLRKYVNPEPSVNVNEEEKSDNLFIIELSPRGDPISDVYACISYNKNCGNCQYPLMMSPNEKYTILCHLPNSAAFNSGDLYSLKLKMSYKNSMTGMTHSTDGIFSGKVE